MSNDNRLPTLEEFKETILAARRSSRAAVQIAQADGNRRAEQSWQAMVKKYDKLVAKYMIEEAPPTGPEPSLEDWRRLLRMPAKS